MPLSIVIPTGGRHRLLAGAIESCLAQELPCSVDCEILVVDNTPSGATRDLVARFADDRLRWIHAPTPGVSEARNAGVHAARGRYVAFLDDDEEASSRWAAALLAHAERGAVAVFGPLQACFEVPPACTEAAIRMFSRRLDVADGADITAWHAYLGTGNSLFDKAACLESDRNFDTDLSGLGGEDSSFLLSLVDRGVRLTWAADALAKEHVPGERACLPSLATRHFRNGQVRSLIRFRAKRWRKLEGAAWMGAGLVQLAGFGLASLALARHRPERAALYKLKACSGAGKVLWMRPFWKLTYGSARAAEATVANAPDAIASGASGPLVSIIVVSYCTRELTLECLRSIARETGRVHHEIIVVDNASDDGSAAAIAREFPHVRLIARPDNVGFARANNMAAEAAKGKYLLLLNPDTVVIDAAIDRLVDFAAARPQARIWGGRTLYADRSLNPASCWRRMSLWNVFCRATGLTGLFPRSPLFNSESYGRWDRSTVREVDIVTGCFLLIEREFWQRLRGFDERFFMYGEEADLCLRAAKLGACPAVTPAATIIHYGGASEKVRSEMMIKLLAGKAELIKRHWSAPTRRLGLALLSLWPLTRAIALSLAGRIARRPTLVDQATTWWTIWGERQRWRHGYDWE
jgi:GT2 family glycosyltransferase